GPRGFGHRLCQRPRNRNRDERSHGSRRATNDVRGSARRRPDQLHQVPDWTLARRRGSGRSGHLRPCARQPDRAPGDQLRHPPSRMGRGCGSESSARDATRPRPLELLRLRRPERLSGRRARLGMSAVQDPDLILSSVRETLASVLALPADSIRPESRVFLDLNAESLDLLDLRFRLEEQFAIRIEQDELARAFGSGLTKEEFAERLTLQSLSDYVRERLGE